MQMAVSRRTLTALSLAAALIAGATAARAGEVSERTLGETGAPVTIVEYASYTCPHCASFHTDTLPEIKERYIDTGKARLVMREFPLDQHALTASVIAQCAGERYFQFADAFFSMQAQWAQASDPRAALTNIARLGGLGEDEVEACLADQAMADSVLQMRLDAVEQHQIESTPSFVIEGEVLRGNPGADGMSEAIDRALAAG